jgi:hypothetical protein
MIRFAIVGTGWRSHFFLRTAAACPDRFEVTALVSRTPEKKKEFHRRYGVTLVPSLDDAIATNPLFVLTSLPMAVNPRILHQLADRNVPVLSERHPGKTLEDLTGLAARVKQGAKIQVTNQYFLQPHHAARIAFVHSGKLGRVSQAQISAERGVGLLRKYLRLTFENPTITATSFTSPLVKFNNYIDHEAGTTLVDSNQIIAWLDYGDSFGIFDFDDTQYGSLIRNQRVLVRGERGELIDHHASYLRDDLTHIEVDFTRHSAGPEGNLEGNYLKGYQAGGEWVYRNPLAPAAMSDEEIAIGECLLGMATYLDGGPPVYSLEDACQDLYLFLLIQEAQESGQPVRAETQPWAP